MTIYLSIFAVLAVLAIGKYWRTGERGIVPIVIAVFFAVFIGFRYEIGVDWLTYELIYLDIARMSLVEALGYGDSAYSLINWIVSRFAGQVWHVNLICAAIFSYALLQFCAVLPRPGLAMVIAVPTLIVVTAMGYTRQATAVGCIMLAFTRFKGTIDWRWLTWLSVAILFHRSAIFALPLFLIAGTKRPGLSIAVGGGLALLLLFTVVLQNLGDVLSLYFEGDIESSGTMPRITIGIISGAAFFAIKDKSIFGDRQDLIRNMAIAMVAMVPLYLVIPSTTVVDRIGILLLPFQSAIFSGFSASFEEKPISEDFVTVSIIGIYAGVLLIWLLFASFTAYWIPYENVLFLRWA